MENKKSPVPDPKSRFAEVTRKAQEARARKPKQVPDEARPNPYKIDTPEEDPFKENQS